MSAAPVPEWDDEYDDADDVHDALHPWMFPGCDDCTDRANYLEWRRKADQ